MQIVIHHANKGCSALLLMLLVFLAGCSSGGEVSNNATPSPATVTAVGVVRGNSTSTTTGIVDSNFALTMPVGVASDALSFKFENTPLTQALTQLETLTRVSFTYIGDEPTSMVSAEVHEQPFIAALTKALPSYDLLVQYDTKKSPRRVWVVSGEASPRLRISTESSPQQTIIKAQRAGRGSGAVSIGEEKSASSHSLARDLQDPNESNRYRALSTALDDGATLSYDVLSTIILADASSAMRLLALAAAEDARLPTSELHDLAVLAARDSDAIVRARADTLLLHTSTVNEPDTALDNSPPSGTNWQ